MADIRQMGSSAPLFEQREIDQPSRRGTKPIADTSQSAWQRKHGRLGIEYMQILAYLADNGPCVHDAIVAAGIVAQSSSGRMGELVTKGWIEVIGKGETRTGSAAKLCRITDDGMKAMRDGMA